MSQDGCVEPDAEEPRPVLIDAEVLSNEAISHALYETVFRAPELALKARPAQFIGVKVSTGRDPFLRRPFSIARVDRNRGTVGILWARVGYGTELMSRWRPGETVNLLGPLGNGFRPGRCKHLILVAGGTGIAPMPFICAESFKENPTASITLLYGAKDKNSMYPVHRLTQETPWLAVQVATEDGSYGKKGLVTGLLEDCLTRVLSQNREGDYDASSTFVSAKKNPGDAGDTRNEASGPGILVFACGPKGMLSAVKAITTSAKIPLYVSLEERMACGLGLCRGCAVRRARGFKLEDPLDSVEQLGTGGSYPGRSSSRVGDSYFHVCLDGPVFSAEDVDLEG